MVLFFDPGLDPRDPREPLEPLDPGMDFYELGLDWGLEPPWREPPDREPPDLEPAFAV